MPQSEADIASTSNIDLFLPQSFYNWIFTTQMGTLIYTLSFNCKPVPEVSENRIIASATSNGE